VEQAQRAADALLAQATLPVEREREGRRRQVDIRPLLHSIAAQRVEAGRVTLRVIMALGQEGTAKPDEIAALLSRTLPELCVRRVHRVRLISAAEIEGGADAESVQTDPEVSC
jgi:hypothetical protein